jgi:hypothetical protein
MADDARVEELLEQGAGLGGWRCAAVRKIYQEE